MLFEDLNLIEPILKALETEGYTKPTPIQEKSIPLVLDRKDLLGCAQTGTGKTAAFAIPIIQLLHDENRNPKAFRHVKCLILTPTRELAIQIGESFAAYGRNTTLRHAVIFGGVSQHSQVAALKSGVDILIATPGRLLDLMNQRYVDLRQLTMFVLDEADRMLDMGFINDVRKVIAVLPPKRQTLFFSATMPAEVAKLADTILRNPAKVEVTPVSSTAQTVQQGVYYVDRPDKKNLLIHILKDESIESALVFTRTKHGADNVVKILTKANVKAEAIHGNKSQNARQRALTNFKTRQTRVLVATDIAARGIDVEELTHVINYELPNIPETYVHRIGRTGRAGASGIALSFCDAEEKEFLRDINKLIAKAIPVVTDHPYPLIGAGTPPEPRRDRRQQGQRQEGRQPRNAAGGPPKDRRQGGGGANANNRRRPSVASSREGRNER
ncbi:DEAD/DEAH box helicase [Tellurirhabdus bombi]|uniref:DEAD/DEAH box helicase n=1 Tax=Tellurirhabdus bombi TaxID=2907205 RepID=UPI001F2DE31E|nr:DEAD/DEAH box helicase [Tellurirhabdus bombi]